MQLCPGAAVARGSGPPSGAVRLAACLTPLRHTGIDLSVRPSVTTSWWSRWGSAQGARAGGWGSPFPGGAEPQVGGCWRTRRRTVGGLGGLPLVALAAGTRRLEDAAGARDRRRARARRHALALDLLCPEAGWVAAAPSERPDRSPQPWRNDACLDDSDVPGRHMAATWFAVSPTAMRRFCASVRSWPAAMSAAGWERKRGPGPRVPARCTQSSRSS